MSTSTNVTPKGNLTENPASRQKRDFPIPSRLNLAITLCQVSLSFWCLYYTANSDSLIGQVVAIVVFSFIMQTGFSLLHEAEHNKLHSKQWINDAQGFVLAAMFPGSYQLMKVAHLNHHKVNRSDTELVDYYKSGENAIIKTVQYYALISGLIWLTAPIVTLVVSLTPASLVKRGLNHTEGSAVSTYLAFIQKAGPSKVRAETIALILFWVGAWNGLNLDWQSLALCYATFAFSWSSQQYIYHVRTPRHLIEGAYDLSVWTPIQWLYLNFNFHLQHHKAVNVPWLYMHKRTVDKPKRRYLPTYIAIWAPPQPVKEAWPVEFQRRGPLQPREKGPPECLPQVS